MQEIIEYKGWVIAVSFLLFLGLEHLFPVVKIGANALRRILKNLLFWPINIALSLLIILPVSYGASEYVLWGRPEWFTGNIYSFFFDILILDMFIFWWHKTVHEVPFLWRFHEVHHLDEHLDTTSAIRFHFGEIFFSAFVRGALIIGLAIPLTSIVVFETLVLVFTLFHHSNVSLPLRIEKPLSYIIVTPSLHWVHHHALRQDTDSNYGTIFSFWDRLFRTKSDTLRRKEMKIGVEGKSDKALSELLILPFIKKDGS